MKKILIIGATSAIAIACARLWAKDFATLHLIGRNQEKLSQIKNDLLTRGASNVDYEAADLNDFNKHNNIIESTWNNLKNVDIVLIAHGSLPKQKICEQDASLTLNEISTNGLSVISLLTIIANKMEIQKNGIITVITSVAADRGRPSNYVYGCAKAAVNTFCDGLRARLHKSGVSLLTIKPGFVDTPMTQGLKLPKVLLAQPDKVAKNIIHAIEKNKNTAYTPWFWSWIMRIVRNIPEPIFKRMSL